MRQSEEAANPEVAAPAKPPGTRFAWGPFVTGLTLLSQTERRLAACVAGAMLLAGLLDAATLTAVLPVVGLIVEPQLVDTNRYVAWLHEQFGRPAHVDFVLWLGLALLALQALNTAGALLVEYAVQHFWAACQNRLGRELMLECVEAPYAWLLARHTASLSRLFHEDLTYWSRGFLLRVLFSVSGLVTVFVGAVLVLVLSPRAGLLSLAVLAVIGLVLTVLIRPHLDRLAQVRHRALDRIFVTTAQVLQGVKDIKLSSREDSFVGVFAEIYRVTNRTVARMNVLQQVLPLSLRLLAQAGLVAIALLLLRTGRGRGEIAAFLALLALVTYRIVPALSQLSSGLGSLWQAYPHIEAIQEARQGVATARAATLLRRGGSRPSVGEWTTLTLSEVGYRYEGAGALAVQNASLEIRRGRSHGLAGISGSGKSTLVDLVLGLLEPTQGEILIDGRPLRDLELRSWQSQIGYVSQTPFLVDDTLRANIAFGVPLPDVDEGRLRECLRLANLTDLAASPEEILALRLGERGVRLSGGQRQRIAIARALYNRPRLLVLDEATSALDQITETAVQEAMDRLQGRLTLLTIAHRTSTLEKCEEIFLLDAGRLVAQGAFAELRARSPLFRRLTAMPSLAGIETAPLADG